MSDLGVGIIGLMVGNGRLAVKVKLEAPKLDFGGIKKPSSEDEGKGGPGTVPKQFLLYKTAKLDKKSHLGGCILVLSCVCLKNRSSRLL